MKKFITDKDNICLRCKNGEINGKYQPKGAPDPLTWCTCRDVNLGGPNKGARQACKAFEAKTGEECDRPC